MSNEIHEHIEHAGHAAHEGHGNLPQWIGITVAVLGVIMALCSAQVGAARTELIATMVEENAAKTRYLSVSNKYRSLAAQLQQVHAAMPNPDMLDKYDEEYNALVADVKNPEIKQGIEASRLLVQKILNTVTPTRSDVERFIRLIARTREEAEAAKEWSESYEGAVKAYTNTSERFEIALLCAEIGIVIASVGLLLARRARFATSALIIAVSLGVTSMAIAGVSKVGNMHALEGAAQKIEATEHHYASLNREKDDIEEDKTLEADIILKYIKRLPGAP